MNENYKKILFCIDYAMEHAFLQVTRVQLEEAALWLKKIAELDYEINARDDEETKHD